MKIRHFLILASCLLSWLPASGADISELPREQGKTPVILIAGEIEPGDDAIFRNIAAKHPEAVVVLNSEGGSIGPAMDIGRTIKLREYSTAVVDGDICASACALIWLAGAKRMAFENDSVGFHASYLDVDGKQIETGLGNALVGHYLSQIGMQQKTVVFATAAPPDKILWLRRENANASGIDVTWLPVGAASSDSSVTKSKSPVSSPPPPPPIIVSVHPPAQQAPHREPASQLASDWIADSKQTTRNIEEIASGLRRRGFQAEVSYEDRDMPSISTGYGGQNFMISFSACTGQNCNYLQLIDFYTDLSRIEIDNAFNYIKEHEMFSSGWTDKDRKHFVLYHYMVLGKDGVTLDNLIDNMEYFVKSNGDLERYILSLR